MYNSNILKTTILSLIFTFIITLSFAQDYQAERNPNESNPYSIQNSPESMWDLQFAYNLQDTLFGVGALAGVIHFDDEFWVSQWNTDSLFRFNEAGQILERFTISGLSSTRSMTFDGTYLWMGTASTTIYKVNPTTRTIVSTLTVPEKARYLTYDALGNNGGGTFWLGDWNTDIYQIDTIGDILTTIDAATHGLTGMYGAAVDNSSLGGPYLWVHWQDGSSSESEIAQLKLPNGTPTGVSFDVTTLAGASNGLAGGLFISDSIVLGQSTLGGIIQNSPNTLFGLELDFQVINYDVEMIDFSHNGQYHEIPLGRTTGLTSVAPNIFTAKVRNNGQETIDVKVNMWLECNGTTIYSDSTIFLGMANLDIQTSSMSNFPWHNRGTYIAYAKATILGNTEEVPGNNIALNTFYITDSTMARDDRQVLSNPYILNIGNTVESEIGVLYTFNQDVIVNSLEIELANPTDGAFTHAIIYRQGASTGLPDITIAESTLFVNIVAGQYVYTLPFDAPVALAAGNYIVAIHQPRWNESRNGTIELYFLQQILIFIILVEIGQ